MQKPLFHLQFKLTSSNLINLPFFKQKIIDLTITVILFFLAFISANGQVTQEWAKRYSHTLSYESTAIADMAVDAQGNVYVTGSSTAFDSDYITVKYNADGSQAWVRRFDGSGNTSDVASAIAVDTKGNVYVTGRSQYNLYSPPFSQVDFNTVMYTSDGKEQWVKHHSSGEWGEVSDIAVDTTGNVYITGYFVYKYGANHYVTLKYGPAGQAWGMNHDGTGIYSSPESSSIAVDGNGHAYVLCMEFHPEYGTYYITRKITFDGTEGWSKPYGGSIPNPLAKATDIAVDGAGNVYVTGSRYDSLSSNNYITMKYTSTGVEQWARPYNHTANGDDQATAIALDGSGNVYVTGSSLGNGTSKDFATVKYSSNGTQLWVSRYNHKENGDDLATALVVDVLGNVYINGTSYGGSSLNDWVSIKYTSAGAEQWVQRHSNSSFNGDDKPKALGVDGNGHVYVMGTVSNSTSTEYPTVKYNVTGNKQWEIKPSSISLDENGEDKATAMTVDANGNVYVTGNSVSKVTNQDFATVKYSANGDLLWVRRFNGQTNKDEYATAIAVDASGNVYVTGYSYFCEMQYGECDYNYTPTSNYATVKYSSDGTQLWEKYYDGESSFDDKATALTVDSRGNVYVTGSSYYYDFTSSNLNVYATIKYSTEGTEQWVRRVNANQPTAITTDGSGNVYVTGTGHNLDFVTVKYDPNGTQIWLKTYNGPGNGADQATAMAIDSNGSLYVLGSSEGSGTGQDFALVKYTSIGNQEWVKRYNSSSYDQAKGVALDKCGGVYVTGITRNSNQGIVYRTLKYTTSGTLQWIKSYGDGSYPGVHEKVAIAVDENCNVLIAGSDNLSNRAQYVVIKYKSDGTQLWLQKYQSGANSNDQATAIALNGNGNVYVTGNSKIDYVSTSTDYATIKLNQSTSPSLPSPWKNGDIGAVALVGNASYSNGTFTLKSGGFDFYRAPDAFHYVYQPFTGNATIVAKVESMGNTNANALAGVMIREDLTASSSFVAAAVNPTNTNFMYRQGVGTPGYKSVTGSAPRWLKLSRSGNSFTSSYSSDGVNWIVIGSITINMGSNIYVGMALTSQNNTQLNTATFSNVSVSITPTSPTCSATGTILREYWANVTGTAIPTIPLSSTPTSSTQLSSFEAPSNVGDNYGQRIRGYICPPATGSYTFYIASDDYSELWLSSSDNPASKQKIASVTGWTSSRQWTKFASQKSLSIYLETGKKYYIEALHKEAAGGDNLAVAWQTPVNSTIAVIPSAVLSPFSTSSPTNQRPIASITSPTNGATFIAPASITINANASDTDGTVSKVEFFSNGTKLGEDLTAPYSFTWSGVGAGTYLLTARATDNGNATSAEAALNIIVNSTTPTACSATGTILREYWANITGTTVSSIPVTATPTTSSQLSTFEAPTNVADNYGQRIRGYICASATGSYTFYIASDDHSELWLSTSDNPASKQKIASVTGYTTSRQWTKFASQKSVAISLQAGKKYYIEALHKEGAGGDNLAVAWTTPGNATITVIPGSVLSPVTKTARLESAESGILESTMLTVYPNPFEDKLTIALDGLHGKIIVTLTDIVGKQYYQKEHQILEQQENLEINLSAFKVKAGVHLLRLHTEEGQSKVIKVIKNK
ncbi:SBBP repeat-containing protein [Rhodocytophaga aerolata]|uniref:SBBP repeat-containing protein n=1 Tax=Rhodocytophaga aerolata TaxID=455078 RepID=A0ABT8R4U7_9BACT|nr:SBBP repeat-containing protein [Rhodocytophaga aerolata]MDO1446318.1 SBBP repeat-containing protein [Rhodocytophaga aerolata]